MKMNLTKIIPCSLVIILLSCSEVKLPDFNVYAEGQKEVLDALVGQGKSAQEILEMNPAKEIIEEAPFPILVNRALVGKGLL
tara:strand:+ start:84 stop:329 length:246 start_codon:yes stop_codon:yes gene_type:complete